MNMVDKLELMNLKNENQKLEIENRRLSAFTNDLTSQLADFSVTKYRLLQQIKGLKQDKIRSEEYSDEIIEENNDQTSIIWKLERENKKLNKLKEENHRLEGGVNLLRQKIDDLERELDDVRPYKEWYRRRTAELHELKDGDDDSKIWYLGEEYKITTVVHHIDQSITMWADKI